MNPQPQLNPSPQYDSSSRPGRWDDPLKFLPVILVAVTIFGLGSLYVGVICIPRCQLGIPDKLVDEEMRAKAVQDLLVFAFFTAMLLINYGLSVHTHPGSIPDGHPHWEYLPQVNYGGGAVDVAPKITEMKKSGERRHCKWCGKYKPDRCHHCRVCNTCILKMDHHCPWIYNCVGYWNYKYFFLLLLYCVFDLHHIFFSSLGTIQKNLAHDDNIGVMFLSLFCGTLAFSLAMLITAFFGFHLWLMLRAMTTIEFCEKHMVKKTRANVPSNLYDLGLVGNIQAVLGNNPLLWFLPIGGPSHDGLHFETTRNPASLDLDDSQNLHGSYGGGGIQGGPYGGGGA